MLKTSEFPVVRVTEEYLLDHIDIIIGSGRALGGSSLLGDILSRCSRFTTVVRTTPVIFHLLVQLLLCLARTGIGSAVGPISLLRAVVTSTPATAAAVRGALVGALSGNITVDVVWSGLGDVAAMRTATATTASAICVVLGAHAAVVTGALNAVQEAGSRALCRVEGVTVTAAADERKTDGLALGVGSVILLNGGVCILQAGVCNKSNSLRASSAVVRDSKFRNRSNSSEEILFSEEAC
jgi:hypothetical protein